MPFLGEVNAPQAVRDGLMLATSQEVPLKKKHVETFRMNSERTGSPEICPLQALH